MEERPKASSESVSAFMKRMPRTNTGPELALRRALHALGLRYRLHDRTLPGTPDIVFRGPMVAVFVDGCFWHGCSLHGVPPKANTEFWRSKIEANQARDRRADNALVDLGWLAVHVWEHEDPAAAAVRVLDVCSSRRGRDAGVSVASTSGKHTTMPGGIRRSEDQQAGRARRRAR